MRTIWFVLALPCCRGRSAHRHRRGGGTVKAGSTARPRTERLGRPRARPPRPVLFSVQGCASSLLAAVQAAGAVLGPPAVLAAAPSAPVFRFVDFSPAAASTVPGTAEAELLPFRRAFPPVYLIQDTVVRGSGGFSVANISGPPDTPLPIAVVLPGGIRGKQAFMMFYDLPMGFRLSAGVAGKEGWRVPLEEADSLSLVPPPRFTGTFSFRAALFTGPGTASASRTVAVRIKPDADMTPAARALAGSRLTAPPEPAEKPSGTARLDPPVPPPPAARDDAAQDSAQMRRAASLVKSGDIAAARLIFARLAKDGNADAAYAMAQTYDPEFLGAQPVLGLQPDLREALAWYARAASLGSKEAAQRLKALQGAEN